MPFMAVIIFVWSRSRQRCILAAVRRFFVDGLRTFCAEKPDKQPQCEVTPCSQGNPENTRF